MSYAVEQPQHLRITFHDLGGRVIAVLLDQLCPTDAGTIDWSGKNTHGGDAPSGTYVVRLETNGRVVARKVMLVR